MGNRRQPIRPSSNLLEGISSAFGPELSERVNLPILNGWRPCRLLYTISCREKPYPSIDRASATKSSQVCDISSRRLSANSVHSSPLLSLSEADSTRHSTCRI